MKHQLTPKQTLLLGETISAVRLANLAAEQASRKLEELENSMLGDETPFAEAVCEAQSEMEEAVANLSEAAAIEDFAYETESERRVSKMLRGMRH
jgi:hypothetical protein